MRWVAMAHDRPPQPDAAWHDGVRRRLRWRRRIDALFVLLAFVVIAAPSDQPASAHEPGDSSPGSAPKTSYPAPVAPVTPPQSFFLGTNVATNSQGWRSVLPGGDARGALVIVVFPSSPAEVAGLAQGDVIVAVDDEEVRSAERLEVLVRSTHDAEHLLSVVAPDGSRRTLAVRLSSTATIDSEAFVARLADDPNPTNRFVFAQTTTDPNVSMAIVDRLVSEHPGFAAAYGLRATRLLQVPLAASTAKAKAERTAAVNAAIATVVEIDPASLDTRISSAQVLADIGDQEGAQLQAEAAVAIDAGSARAHQVLGSLRLDAGQAKAALPELHRAVELNPYAARYYSDLSRCYNALGRKDLARQTDEALRILLAGPAGPKPRTGGEGSPLPVAVAVGVAVLVGGAVPVGLRRTLARRARVPEPVPPPASPATTPLWPMELAGALGLCSVAVPSTSRMLGLSPGTPARLELANHVIPGLVAATVAAVALSLLLRGRRTSPALTIMPVVTALAGLWVSATHLLLLREAARGLVPWEAALLHAGAGPALLVVLLRMYVRTPAPGQAVAHGKRPRPAARGNR